MLIKQFSYTIFIS